jgi:ABC-type Fe3+/spermidine/putrescine transport system ATPase subunit
LRLERLSLRLGAFRLSALDLDLPPGEILVILGPNGAGKSVTLEAIAGFHRVEAGRILIGARDVTDLPPERRRVSLLFQNFALFPHLTVAGNVALALRAAGEAPHPRRSEALLARFGVANLADRLPEMLSPGEKQRAALARALAGRPELFLFDEPFSALDGPTRATLRDGLIDFLRNAGVATIFVTHDHVEALALADTLVLMRDGEIVQRGAAAAVYRAPATAFAAEFLGVENILAARLLGRAGAACLVAVGETVLRADADETPRHAAASVAIRAEDVAVSKASPSAAGPGNTLAATVVAITNAGALTKLALDCGFRLIAAISKRQARELELAPGAAVTVEIEPASIRLLA